MLFLLRPDQSMDRRKKDNFICLNMSILEISKTKNEQEDTTFPPFLLICFRRYFYCKRIIQRLLLLSLDQVFAIINEMSGGI